MSDFNRLIHRAVIEDDRLKKLTRRCPDHGNAAIMTATGRMFLAKSRDDFWTVEYLCPRDNGLYTIWVPETDALTKAIAAEHDKESKDD
jgi:hypothetical protein